MKRILDEIIENDFFNEDLIILSNYFTSKNDPQRAISIVSNDFDYIKNWYFSIVRNRLSAVVFHDGLDLDFIERYKTKKIIFLECRLGSMSLNDERFFIFNEFLNYVKEESFVLITDINDVVVVKSPLEFMSKSPQKIFIGRDDHRNWGSGYWSLIRLNEFKQKLSLDIPSGFICFPVLNAGLIGGKKSVIKNLLNQMIVIFSRINDEGNYNMVVLNWVIFKMYFSQKRFYILIGVFSYDFLWKLHFSMRKGKMSFLKVFLKEKITTNGEGLINTELLFSGFPYNSLFKKFESQDKTGAFLIHK